MGVGRSNGGNSQYEDRNDEVWSGRPSERGRWRPLDEMDVPESSLIELLCHNDGFHLEFGQGGVAMTSSIDNFIEDASLDVAYYAEHMAGVEHANWMTPSAKDATCSDPMSLSVQVEPCGEGAGPKRNMQRFRALLRTKDSDGRMVLLAPSFKEVLKSLRGARPEATANAKFAKVKAPEVVDALVNFERQGIVSNYKFGVLYALEGQSDEDDMFSNTDASPHFAEFLDFLGETISLQGWPRFAGGLDTKQQSTGDTSVYTRHEGFEIMFHVSTMLPFNKADKQQLERKRHLGNDVVVIVFQEGEPASFSPTWLASHFNHVFVVVQRDIDATEAAGGLAHYRIAIINKSGVRPYTPFLPSPAVFPKDQDFKHFFLTKLINGERAAMSAPPFREKLSRTRRLLLTDLANKFLD
jgi:Rap/ran-GAP